MRDNELPEGGMGASEPMSPGGPSEPRKDYEVTEGVRAALLLDPELSAEGIDVDTVDGIVHLRGTVKGEALRRRVEEIANTVEGAERVENHLGLASQRKG
ncbi:MAG: BON domain-containing protein [Chloroflexota bacterium]